MGMGLVIRCRCGKELRVESRPRGATVTCPDCGRPHAIPSSDRSVGGRMTIALSAAAVVAICGALLWAMTDQGGGGSGTQLAVDNGGDPYAARRSRGGGGTGVEGNGPGSGESGTGTGNGAAGNSAASGQPAANTPAAEQNQSAVETTTQPDEFAISDVKIDPRIPPDKPSATQPFLPTTGAVASTANGGRKGVGGGGAYGQRGDSDVVRANGGTRQSEAAVELGLAWLAKVQEKDGAWTCDCEIMTQYPGPAGSIGATGLATLAFLGAGYTHQDKGQYHATVDKALTWLLKQQDKEGRFKSQLFYEQGIATMVLCEAYGMTQDPLLRKPAEKGVEFILKNMGKSMDPKSIKDIEAQIATLRGELAALNGRYKNVLDHRTLQSIASQVRDLQNQISELNRQLQGSQYPEGGFGYNGPGNDAHVTSFQVMALKSAKLAKLDVPEEAFDRLRKYYDMALRPDYRTNYGVNITNNSTKARTALGLFCRIFLDVGTKSRKIEKIADVIAKDGPMFKQEELWFHDKEPIPNYFQIYYGTYGMFQMGGDYWKNWNSQFRDRLIAEQFKNPENLRGSWTPGFGGRVVTTAIAIMALEVYYRYLPVNR